MMTMRNFAVFLSIAALSVAGDALAQAAQSGAPAGKPAAQGPKVHVSESKDVTGCTNSKGGPMTGAGIAAGGYIGNKVGDGGDGIMYGALVGQAVGDHLGRKHRCDPRAKVEDGASQTEEPKKKKLGWGSLKKALDL